MAQSVSFLGLCFTTCGRLGIWIGREEGIEWVENLARGQGTKCRFYDHQPSPIHRHILSTTLVKLCVEIVRVGPHARRVVVVAEEV